MKRAGAAALAAWACYRVWPVWTVLAVALLVALLVVRNVRGGSGRRRSLKAASVAGGTPGGGPGVVYARRPALDRPAWLSGVVLASGAAMLAVRRWPLQVGTVLVASGLGWLARLALAGHWRIGLAGLAPALAGAAVLAWRRARLAPSSLADLWRAEVARGNPADGRLPILAGSRVLRVVEDRDPDGGGLRRTGLLVAGRDHQAQPFPVIAREAARISAVYGVQVEVAPVEHPGRAMVWVPDAAWLAWLAGQAARQAAARQERLAQVHLLERGGLAAGTADVAVRVDDGGPGLWRLWTPGVGAHHGQLVGQTRSGKSEGAHTLYRVACQAGLVVPFVADLAGGVSMAWWQERARVYATTPAEAVAMLALMDEEFERRVAWMFARGVKVLDPSPDWPHLRAFVDEAPELANDKEGQRLVGKALRQWAKAGMAIDVASQVGHAAVTWGRDVGTAMSEQIANVWAFRAGVQTSRIVMHGTEMDLSQLPRGVPGASFLWTPDHPEPVMVRGRWDREPDASWLDVPRWAPGAPAPRVPDRAAPEVRDGSAQDRIVAVLAGGPMTEAAIVAATGLGKTRVNDLLRSMPQVVKDRGYGGRWSLVEVKA